MVYDGLRINVRAVAYRPSWEMVSVLKKEQLRFDIAKANNRYKYTANPAKRGSEIYVFCVHTNQGTPSPLELEAWRFFIFKTSVIDEMCRNSKYITLKTVNELCKAGLGHYCMFDGIKATIDNLYSHSEWKGFAENDFIYRSKLVQYLSKRKWNSYVPSVEEAILNQCPNYRLLKWVEPYWDCEFPKILLYGCKGVSTSYDISDDEILLRLEIDDGFGEVEFQNGKEESLRELNENIQDAAKLFFECMLKVLPFRHKAFYKEFMRLY